VPFGIEEIDFQAETRFVNVEACNFKYAIIGDRGGGANPLGTFNRTIEQLNWMQPEFVMSVGAYDRAPGPGGLLH
jgi:hypothetical protein